MWRLADGLLLAGLIAYVIVGTPIVTFHGDEGMQVYATSDFNTAFVDRNPAELMTQPPYYIDSRPHLRILNGSVQRYTAGLVLYLRGHNEGDLPQLPGWNWGLSYDDNVAGGWLPKNSVLMPARYTSATFFAASIIIMFAIGWQIGGRISAYTSAVLYGLNPILLLNVRRAMMEGTMLFFGVLTILMAVIIARQLTEHGRFSWFAWVILPLVGGLTLASKHTGAVFLIGAWLWIFIAAIVLWQARIVWLTVGLLAFTGVLALSLFVGLSPALWNNPIARVDDLVKVRSELLSIQVSLESEAPTTFTHRIYEVITEAFIAPQRHFEVGSWREIETIGIQIQHYNRSGLAGLPNNLLFGIPLTTLSWMAVILLLSRRPATRQPYLIGIVVWFGITILSLMLNPLPWQRYYLPFIPIMVLLTAISIYWICEQIRTTSGVADKGIVYQTDM